MKYARWRMLTRVGSVLSLCTPRHERGLEIWRHRDQNKGLRFAYAFIRNGNRRTEKADADGPRGQLALMTHKSSIQTRPSATKMAGTLAETGELLKLFYCCLPKH